MRMKIVNWTTNRNTRGLQVSNIEQQLIRAGAVLVKCNRHKVYEVQGRRFTLSHGNKSNNSRDRHKPMLHFLNKIKKGQLMTAMIQLQENSLPFA